MSIVSEQKIDFNTFLEAEFENCKRSPAYIYNNYWKIDGKPVKPISDEEWKQVKEQTEKLRLKRRR